jgi:hypothetical protein
MKKLLTVLIGLVVLIVMFLTSGCNFMRGEATEGDIEEQQEIQAGKAMEARDMENKKLRNALLFLQNKSKYSEEELTAVGVPQITFAHALKCMLDCKGNILQYMGLDGCKVSDDMLQEVAAKIEQLACVPLALNIPNEKKRQEYIRAVDDYEPGKSFLVVCYKDEGDMVFHVKNREIVEVF